MNELTILSQESGYTVLENKRSNAKMVYREYPSPSFYSQEAVERELNTRLDVMNKNLIHLYSFIFKDEKEADEKTRMCLIYEYYLSSLEAELSKRWGTNAYWGEDELINTMEAVVNGMRALHDAGICHGNIQGRNIVFAEDGIVKLADNFAVDDSYRDDFFDKIVKRKAFLPPEIIRVDSRNIHQLKESQEYDLWALGMVFLETAVLEPSSELYDWSRKTINREKLENRLSKVKELYSSGFHNMIESLLSFEQSKRRSGLDLFEKLFFEISQSFTNEEHLNTRTASLQKLGLGKITEEGDEDSDKIFDIPTEEEEPISCADQSGGELFELISTAKDPVESGLNSNTSDVSNKPQYSSKLIEDIKNDLELKRKKRMELFARVPLNPILENLQPSEKHVGPRFCSDIKGKNTANFFPEKEKASQSCTEKKYRNQENIPPKIKDALPQKPQNNSRESITTEIDLSIQRSRTGVKKREEKKAELWKMLEGEEGSNISYGEGHSLYNASDSTSNMDLLDVVRPLDFDKTEEEYSKPIELAPQKRSEPAPQKRSEPAPQKRSEPVPQKRSELAPQKRSELAPQKGSELAPQKGSELAPQKGSDIAPHKKAEMVPQKKSEVAPQSNSDLGPNPRTGRGPQKGSETEERITEQEKLYDNLNSMVNIKSIYLPKSERPLNESRAEYSKAQSIDEIVDQCLKRSKAVISRNSALSGFQELFTARSSTSSWGSEELEPISKTCVSSRNHDSLKCKQLAVAGEILSPRSMKDKFLTSLNSSSTKANNAEKNFDRNALAPSNSLKLEKNLSNSGALNGFQVFHLPGGFLKYKGEWLGGLYHGHGCLYNEKKVVAGENFDYSDFDALGDFWDRYEGDFVEGKKHGKGILYLTNNEFFQGNFKNDKLKGLGTFCSRNGKTIIGEWLDNKLKIKV